MSPIYWVQNQLVWNHPTNGWTAVPVGGGAVVWGGIGGTLANQADLIAVLAGKAAVPVYANLGTNLALALGTNDVVKVNPSATGTFTTTVPPAGRLKQVVLLQTNTTQKTMTFGTGFKPTGTLALGTTANRVFVTNWVSDGTFLYEAGRTAAMVA